LIQQGDRAAIRFFQRELTAWYAEHARPFTWRSPTATPFHRIVAELLLQRTKAESVDRVLPSFLAAFPSWRSIAAATEQDLHRYLKPLGLWRRRIPSLRLFAADLERRGGVFPVSREEVERIPAVGQYIANAILLFVHSEPEPLLDVNMARLLERFFGPRRLADIRDDQYLQRLSRLILRGVDPVNMNWAVLDFAALVCRVKNPGCSSCPLSRRCRFAREAR
jgi:A/G-specific adenine glycosylase